MQPFVTDFDYAKDPGIKVRGFEDCGILID